MVYILLSVLIILSIVGPFLAYKFAMKGADYILSNQNLEIKEILTPQVYALDKNLSPEDLKKEMSIIQKGLKDLPLKTLRTIQGSVSNTTGKIGEMMQMIELQRSYDRLIVLNDISDFLGIKFPEGDDPGHIDFVEIKTGDRAALSADQKKFRDMVQGEAPVTFKTVKVTIS